MNCQIHYTAIDDYQAEGLGAEFGQAMLAAGGYNIRSGSIGLEAYAFGIAEEAKIRDELYKLGHSDVFVACR